MVGMTDLLEQSVRYLEALSDAIADHAPASSGVDFVSELVESLRECAGAVQIAHEEGYVASPVYSHPGDGDTRAELANRIAEQLFPR